MIMFEAMIMFRALVERENEHVHKQREELRGLRPRTSPIGRLHSGRGRAGGSVMGWNVYKMSHESTHSREDWTHYMRTHTPHTTHTVTPHHPSPHVACKAVR